MVLGKAAGRWRAWAWVLAALGTLGVGGAARAADLETRDFVVRVDGKPAGDYHLTIHRQDDGITQVSGDTDVKVTYFVVKYTYRYRGREIWKDGRLHALLGQLQRQRQPFRGECRGRGGRPSYHRQRPGAALRVPRRG